MLSPVGNSQCPIKAIFSDRSKSQTNASHDTRKAWVRVDQGRASN